MARQDQPEESPLAADTPAVRPPIRRLVCDCSIPPILLATLDRGQVNLKIRDRYYHIEGVNGRVRAICPKCGKEHVLMLGDSRQ